MKEAMRAIDRTSSYSFSDAHVEQQELFREDDAERSSESLFREFDGRDASYDHVHLYALNETPLLSAKTMLAILEKTERLKVETYGNEPRRVGAFAEDKIRRLRFGRFGETTAQGELRL